MEPLRFAFGIHVHQPVGNFDHVFESHVREAYLPFLQCVAERGFLPISIHISGPLLDWLGAHGGKYLDLIGTLVSQGKAELLLAGYYEPILAALPKVDRVEQIGWMREVLRSRFGVDATGLWLTERVWEPDLPADLAAAGVRYALVDDRHFLVSGFERNQLHAPWFTESDGKRVALFPIDERLRYLVPFQPEQATAAYLRELRAAGHPMAIFADDGEKFGGWPGTIEWVYDRGWLDRFCTAIVSLVETGEVQLSTFGDALTAVPSAGLCYLPTASYREMEGWSLPPRAAVRLATFEEDLGPERVAGPDGSLIRGAHWRNFLAKYPESNRMHKKMVHLSTKCRADGNPKEIRRAIGKAQCNDAYWHGVFGGLYLPHLRAAIWEHLARAEGDLRQGEGLVAEVVDFDFDGRDELWIHSSAFSAVVSPSRGGVIEEYTVFASGCNYADVLSRRREAYHEHRHGASDAASGSADTDRAPSIHDIEKSAVLAAPPPVDTADRALFVDRILAPDVTLDAYRSGRFTAESSWAGAPFEFAVSGDHGALEVIMRPGPSAPRGLIDKRLRFEASGALSVHYRWDPSAFNAGALFTTEMSLARPLRIVSVPNADLWQFPIATVSKSERGFEETLQGTSYTARWPVAMGEVRVELAGAE